MMMGLIERLQDLHKQATTERSHFYVAKTCLLAIDEIERLQSRVAELEALLVELRDETIPHWSKRTAIADIDDALRENITTCPASEMQRKLCLDGHGCWCEVVGEA